LKSSIKKFLWIWIIASLPVLLLIYFQTFSSEIYTGKEIQIGIWIFLCISPCLLTLLYANFKSTHLTSDITRNSYNILIFFILLYWFFLYATLFLRVKASHISNYELKSLLWLIPLQLFILIPLCISIIKNTKKKKVEEFTNKNISHQLHKPNQRKSIFISYHQKDVDYMQRLDTQLSALVRNYKIQIWNNNDILPGAEREKEIRENLKTAEIILLLISPDFVHCDWCYLEEMSIALKQQDIAYVIPIIIRPCDWKESEFGHLQQLPKNGIPISKWNDKDEAFLDIISEIKSLIN